MKVKIDNATRKVFTSKPIIGVVGEINQETISVSFFDEMVDGFGFLEINNGESIWAEPMEKVDGGYSLLVGGSMLSVEGDISLQFKVAGNSLGTGAPIFKSEIFKVTVYKAIGAEHIVHDYSNLLNVISRTATVVSSSDLVDLGKVGAYAFYNYTNLQEIYLPEGCTSIENYAFYGCSNLRKVVLPSTLKTIGQHAFDGCSSLVDIDFSNVESIAQYAFNGCSSLQSISLLAVNVGDNAFSGCTSLAEVSVDFGFTYGQDVFDGCTNITKVSCPNLITWASINFSNAKSNPTYYANNLWIDGEVVTELDLVDFYRCGDYAFVNCKDIIGVVCPAIIGKYAFMGCSGIADLYIYENVESIGNGAFADCDGITTVTCVYDSWFTISFGDSESNPLRYNPEFIDDITGETITEIHIPTGVNSIPSFAFYGYNLLQNITDENRLVSIGHDAFNSCNGLVDVVLGGNLTQLSDGVFANSVIQNFVCSANMSTVSRTAFQNANVISVTAPMIVFTRFGNSIIYIQHIDIIGTGRIPHFAFAYHLNLISLVVGNGINEIGQMAFQGCPKLATVEIGTGIENIDDYAFEACQELASITIWREDAVPTLGTGVFNTVAQNFVIYVPSNLVNDYKVAQGWANYSDHIQAIQE